MFARLILAGIALTAAGSAAAQQQAVAFINVTIIPMDRERLIEGQTVLVRDGRIAEIGPAGRVTLPAGTLTIESRGKFLMPGLGEMHAHIPPANQAEWSERVLFLYVANGITTIRGMLGQPEHLEIRKRVDEGQLIGPRIWTSGPSTQTLRVTTPDSARAMVESQKAAGYDFMKIHPGQAPVFLPREAFDTLDAVADRLGMKFSGHVPPTVGVPRALEARYASIDHLDSYMHTLVADGAPVDLKTSGGFFGIAFVKYVDEAKIRPIAQRTREAGVWNVPTNVLMENIASDETPEAMAQRPDMQYLPPQMVQGSIRQKRSILNDTTITPEMRHRFIEIRRHLVKALHDAGAGLLLGSDAPQWWNAPGFSAHRELQALVAAGLTPYQALETGTRNVATFFGTTDRAGTVERGKWADLILLDANPLTDITNTTRRAGVMVRGRWLPAVEIDAGLKRIAEGLKGE